MRLAAGARRWHAVAAALAAVASVLATVSGQTSSPDGNWVVLGLSGGSAVHAMLTYLNTIVFIDFPIAGYPAFPNTGNTTYTVQSYEFTLNGPNSGNVTRYLWLGSQAVCSGGVALENGNQQTLGGNFGNQANNVQTLYPGQCAKPFHCGWNNTGFLQVGRWYPSNVRLIDGRIIVIGGNVLDAASGGESGRTPIPNYEYYPPGPNKTLTYLPILNKTDDPLNEYYTSSYPISFLLPSGKVFVMSIRSPVLLDPVTDTWVDLPEWPFERQSVTYPFAAGSALLPLSPQNDYFAEVLICGGTTNRTPALQSSTNPKPPASGLEPALDFCGRIAPDLGPLGATWEFETMPSPRVMGDLLCLADGKLVLLNGIKAGRARLENNWQGAANFLPVLYDPKLSPGSRMRELQANSTIGRGYHSAAVLYADGRVIVTGSNPNHGDKIYPNNTYPTEFRVQAFTPPYLLTGQQRPVITAFGTGFSWGATFLVSGTVRTGAQPGDITVSFMQPGHHTHSMGMGASFVWLAVQSVSMGFNASTGSQTFSAVVQAPPNASIALPSYYLMFVLDSGVPSETGVWTVLQATPPPLQQPSPPPNSPPPPHPPPPSRPPPVQSPPPPHPPSPSPPVQSPPSPPPPSPPPKSPPPPRPPPPSPPLKSPPPPHPPPPSPPPPIKSPPPPHPPPPSPPPSVGSYAVLSPNIGIVGAYAALTKSNTILYLDRLDVDQTQTPVWNNASASAHSVEFTITSGAVHGLTLQSNPIGSSGHSTPDGHIVSMGGALGGTGYYGVRQGYYGIRTFLTGSPTSDFDLPEKTLRTSRYQGAAHRLPNGNLVVVGGQGKFTDLDTSTTVSPSYEVMIKGGPYSPIEKSNANPVPFLAQATPYDQYPILHLLKDGTFFLFASYMSCTVNLTSPGPVGAPCIKTFPALTDGSGNNAPRTSPLPAASVLLPLDASVGFAQNVLVCGGGSPTLATCGILDVDAASPNWALESMPGPRVMSDAVLLPTGDVLLINGASSGLAGNNEPSTPLLAPYLLAPSVAVGSPGRWTTLASAATPRAYLSTATLVADGRVVLAGGNPNQNNTLRYYSPPAILSVEAFSPPYLSYSALAPTILTAPATVGYGATFTVTFMAPSTASEVTLVFVDTGYHTHGLGMGQRSVKVAISALSGSASSMTVTAIAPPNANYAPPGYYLLFVVIPGPWGSVPSPGVWMQVGGVPNYPPPPPSPPPSR
eukprot:SM000305S11801  [mRNA]  locus=s305:80289:86160:+ [translate_table: standard]